MVSDSELISFYLTTRRMIFWFVDMSCVLAATRSFKILYLEESMVLDCANGNVWLHELAISNH